MQAIILAAGMGKRLGDLTKDNTKCMVEVNGIKLIDRALTQLSKLSLTRVVLVIGYEGGKLRDYVGDNYKGLKVEYIENPVYDKTNNIYSLWLAKDVLAQDDTLLIESDLIFDDSLFQMLVENPYPSLALVAKYEPWMDGTMVCIDNNNNILSFVPKKMFRYQNIGTYYKTVNIYKFSKNFSTTQYIPFLEAYTKSLGNNEYYEQVLRVITMLDKCELKALPLNGRKWYEIDDIQDLDIAETLFADDDIKLDRMYKRFGGYWRFPRLLDFCYLVNPYFPTTRLKNELKSSFEDLLTQYPSGMRINSMLLGKYFGINGDYVCAGNGAAELIKALMENSKGKLGVVFPTFEEYPNRYEKTEICAFVPKNDNFSYTADDLLEFFADKNISTLLLINPDNPSGNFILKADVERMAIALEKLGVKFVLDESFVDFSDESTANSLLDNAILERHPNMAVVKSISKSYGVPGLRLGLIASADKNLIGWLRKDVAIWNINSFAEYYLQIFGKYESDYKCACRQFIAERARFLEDLKTVSYLRVIPSQANYFLCEVTDKFTSHELAKVLLCQYNLLIKDCGTKSAFEDRNYIRLAVRDTADNKKLVETLKLLESNN